MREDGTPFGWHKFGGSFEVVASPVQDGQGALAITSQTESTKWVYQAVAVEGGEYYEASVYALKNDPNVESVFLRLSFYASSDGSGSAIESVDSTVLATDEPSFVRASTGAVQAPDTAASVRVRLMLRPASQAPATAIFDAVTFAPAQPLTPMPTPSATTTPTPTAPSTPTPAPSDTPDPVETASPAPTGDEPLMFAQLTNGSFEQKRSDGTPFGWRKVGGEPAVTDAPKVDGASALAFTSSTGSTKWVYQAIRVEPLAYYDASVYAVPSSSVSEAFLRLSWYESEDGSGAAIGSDDSLATATGSAFEFVWTGPVQAPSDARSVKLKLMLRPGTESQTTAYFDAVTFTVTDPPADEPVADRGGTGSDSTPDSPSLAAASDTSGTAAPSPAVLGAASTPIRRANVTRAPMSVADASRSSSGANYDWAIAMAIVIPLMAFAFLGLYELRRPRRNAEP